MNWFEILKVNIDFVDSKSSLRDRAEVADSFGVYGRGLDINPMTILGSLESNDKIRIKDFIAERILINHKLIYSYLKEKLGKEPTEKQLRDYITRIIMHESTHAGMGLEQDTMSDYASEYGAFVGQFPESTYLRLKAFLQHPSSKNLDQMAISFTKRVLEEIIGSVPPDRLFERMTNNKRDYIERLLKYTENLTKYISNKGKREDIMEKIIRKEISDPREYRNIDAKVSFESARERYGQEVANALFEEKEKMAGAVTTSSSPSLFNVSYSNKRRRKEDA